MKDTPPMRRIKTSLTIALVLCLSILAMLPLAAEAKQDESPIPEDLYVTGVEAMARLGGHLQGLAAEHGLNAWQLRSMLANDETLFVDGSGELVYFDVLAPGEPEPASAGTGASTTAAGAPLTQGPEFLLSSNPGADKTIFLDFDGHVTTGTTWNSENGLDTIVSPPYDTDGDPSSWSTAELNTIAGSWIVVAEDFAPWNVNVTTIDPGPEALRRSGGGDNQWGVRVVITKDTVISCGCGGAAYIGSFDDPADEPAFVFNSTFVGVAEAISHEVGHSLLLAHDGSSTSGYYQGHGATGTPGWAPIMGASYYQPVTQWSQQEYSDANNSTDGANFGHGNDDVAIISSMTNGNNFGLRPDDHGDTVSAATPITETSVEVAGLIGTRQDIDVFSFSTTGGLAELSAAPAEFSSNLDIALTVRDGSGKVVVTANPPESLEALISVELASGEYSIEINGVGVGSPIGSSPSGYTDYASLGRYGLAVSITESSAADGFVLGDVNCDGQSTVIDALIISQYGAGTRTGSAECPVAGSLTEIYLEAADVNDDQNVNVIDALMIAQCGAGLLNDFCTN